MFRGLFLVVSAGCAQAEVRYVDASSTNATPPYTNWTTSAATIQEAVDAAVPGDEIVVTNGIYATGGRPMGTNVLANRVAVEKPLTLRSVNGPQVTVIRGAKVPTGYLGCGNGAYRCVSLVNGASLSGFTLMGGATRTEGNIPLEQSGGGVWCETQAAIVTNCVVMLNSAWYGGGAYGGTLIDCTLITNSASTNGGGACGSVLDGCVLIGNSSRNAYGGGAHSGSLSNCVLEANVSLFIGGGASSNILNNCILRSNFARHSGGGATDSTLNNCTLAGNSSTWEGGGALSCTLSNCNLTSNSSNSGGGAGYSRLYNSTLTGNRAGSTNFGQGGGGAYESMLLNCTVVSNSTAGFGGGVAGNPNSNPYNLGITNCIVYFNTASSNPNYSWSGLYYSCTTPKPIGVGNITNAPLFVDYDAGDLRLQTNSPCINAGLNAHPPGSTDSDGLPRIVSGTVDIGACEYQGTGSVISYAWLQGFGLPTDGSADAADSDADGHDTWQEWRCQTDPTDALSALRLLSIELVNSNASVTWRSEPGVRYLLQRGTNLSVAPVFATLTTNLTGKSNTMGYIDTNAANAPLVYYRVGVVN